MSFTISQRKEANLLSTYPGYTRKPHYYETDQMAIIHHANYIRWFEEARVDMLDFLGFPYEKMEELGIIVPVLSVNCEYKEMIRYGQAVLIKVYIVNYTGTRLNFQYEIIDQKNQHLLTTGESKHCFLAKETQRLINLKKSFPTIHELFEKCFLANQKIN